MNEHVGNCAYHFSLPRWAAEAIHRQAKKEDVRAEGNDFLYGTPGRHEWEATCGAVKWWPRWGGGGEASLFADFYFRWGDRVEVCVELFTVNDEPQCPWYRMPISLRVAMARLAFWHLAGRAFAGRMETVERALTRGLVRFGEEWNPWFVEQLRQTVQGLTLTATRLTVVEVDLRQIVAKPEGDASGPHSRIANLAAGLRTGQVTSDEAADRLEMLLRLFPWREPVRGVPITGGSRLGLLRRLAEWADVMGGWEAPVWEEVYELVNRASGA